jgi:L-asparagine oxygenase
VKAPREPRRWETHTLTEDERQTIGSAALDTTFDPYLDLPKFSALAADAWNCLSSGTRQRVADLARGVSTRPELYIENLPLPVDLPPTPVHNQSWNRTTTECVSEFAMMVFCAGLGHPLSYLDQRDGKVFHDVYPTPRNASALSSQSSRVGLGFHTEMFFHPQPPEYLVLNCLRSDPEQQAWTSVASLHDIEAMLDPDIRAQLRAPQFALDLARLHGSYVHRGRPIQESQPRPVISVICEDSSWPFRFEPALMTPVGDIAAEALRHVEQAAEATAAGGVLREGGLLLIDNRRAVHSRSSFPTRFDGSDRWLRRLMIGRAEPDAGEAVLRFHDLELVRPWMEMGVLLETVPYASTSGSAR